MSWLHKGAALPPPADPLARAPRPRLIDGFMPKIEELVDRDPQPGFGDLAVAKSAVEGAARALARELGPQGVRVNIVAAGPTLTRTAEWAGDEIRRRWAARTPLGRNADADDVAGAIVLLASPLARFCTGAYLPANGGVIMM